jgi:arsenate reductase
MIAKPQVLFVCVHDAGRSQMAAALLDRHARGRVSVRSAGSDPGLPGEAVPRLGSTRPGRPIEEVRPIRDEIDRRIRTLLAELAPGSA